MAPQTPSSSTSEDTKKRKRDNSSCSEEDEKIITSTPSSSSTPRFKYDVFLSFYGKDTRWRFTDHLHHDLKRKGIQVFRDDEALQRGEYISQALLKAIQDSQYAIVIFSTNYASSKWCLRELAEIVECSEEKTKLITIIPIFYHVNPSDVRNQRGTFAKAFAAHEKDPKVDIKEIDMWRNAFRKVGNIKGEHIHDGYESTIIQDISRRISRELNSRFSLHHDYDKLVAIDSQVDKMMELLDMESNDVRFVGIHGMGGVGKTTLAQIVYDRVSCQFEGSSFISCNREKSTTARDLASLQKELLSTIMQEKIRVYNHHQGIGMIIKMLQNKRVFIVLDDVDSVEQLTTLAGDRKWFGPGSRVIITCRDSHLLRTHEVNDIYKVEQLETEKALQLFSLSAFKQTHPRENYKDLSMDFVNYAQGLPLALKVLGSFLVGRPIDAWESERDKLKAIPNPEIMDVLQISFDGLEELQKELFLDMACLFGGQYIFSEMVLERFGHYRIDLDVLVEKSLISKSKYGWRLSMHDLLKELGREIVRRECPEEPGRRSRLFRHEDVFHVLKNDTGTDATKAIVAVDSYAHKKKDRRLNAKAFSKMRKLSYLKFDNSGTIKWSGDPLKHMPTNVLRVLEWTGYHLNSWPSSFQPENLTELRMHGSRMKQLWMGLMVLPNLKLFDLSYSWNLIEIPNLTGVPNLREIILEDCTSLCKLDPSIGSLKKLKSLVLNRCSSLEKLPDLSSLECLKRLWASETAMEQPWKGLMVVPNLMEIDLSYSWNLIEIPNLTGVPNLTKIILEDCTSLCELHQSIGSLKKLESLVLNRCSSLEKLPDLSSLECLTYLGADETAITQIPSVNIRPKISIGDVCGVEFHFRGSKLMRLKSRDPIYDIGSLVEYQKEGTYDFLEAAWTDFDSKGENILDMAGVVISALDDDLKMIGGWSWGFHIPEWVEYKSNGSSVKIDLDANTNLEMGCAFFIVCDSDQFFSNVLLDYISTCKLFEESFRDRSEVWLTIVFETDEEYCVELDYSQIPLILKDSFGKQIGLWVYIPEVLRFLDIRRRVMIKISWKTDRYCFLSKRFEEKEVEVEVKECGVHLVCPDDANSNFFNSIAPFGRSGSSSNSDVHRQFHAEMVNTGTRKN